LPIIVFTLSFLTPFVIETEWMCLLCISHHEVGRIFEAILSYISAIFISMKRSKWKRMVVYCLYRWFCCSTCFICDWYRKISVMFPCKRTSFLSARLNQVEDSGFWRTVMYLQAVLPASHIQNCGKILG